MFSREDIDYYVREIREHPERRWSTTDVFLAGAVFAEVEKFRPEARLYTVGANAWIVQDGNQREDLLHVLKTAEAARMDELEELWTGIRRVMEDA